MSLRRLPERLRQACRRDRSLANACVAGDRQGPSHELLEHPPRAWGAAGARLGPDEINRVYLTAQIVVDPKRERNARGTEITVLLVRVDAPEAAGTSGCLEVDVPDTVIGRHRPSLKAGAEILIAGAVTSTGIWADSIHQGTPGEAG